MVVATLVMVLVALEVVALMVLLEQQIQVLVVEVKEAAQQVLEVLA